MKTLLIALLGLASLCSAQTAPTVVALSAEDADTVKSVHDELATAQQHWENIQKQIGEKYLLVSKDSPDASDKKWYPTSGSWGIYIASGNIVYSNGATHCETEEEKTARLAREAEAKEANERAEAERESKSKRIHKGFDSESDFEFSDDWKFILKKLVPPSDILMNHPTFVPTANQWTQTQ